MKQPIFLRIFSKDTLVAVKQFDSPTIVFGKDAQVDVDLGDDSISNIHAMIEERGGDYYLSDLGSKEGTYLNQEKILDGKIETGDLIGLGNFKIEFYVGVPKPKTKPAISERPDLPVMPNPDQIQHADENTHVTEGSVKAFQEKVKKAEEHAPSVPQAKAEEKAPEEVPQSFTPPEAPSVPPSAPVTLKTQVDASGQVSTTVVEKRRGTYAPKSNYKGLDDIVTPGKGLYLRILVAWGDRIIETHRVRKDGVVSLGTHPKNDIVIPSFDGVMQSQPFVKSYQSISQVFIPKSKRIQLYLSKTEWIDQKAALSRNRLKDAGSFYLLDLQQGEMLQIEYGPNLYVLLTHTNQSPDIAMIPFGGLRPTEIMAVLAALVLTAILSVFVAIYGESKPEEEKKEEVIKVTRFEFKRNEPIPKPKRVEVTDKEVKETKVPSKVETDKKEKLQGEEGKAVALRPNRNPIRKKMKLAAEKTGKPLPKDSKAKNKTAKSTGGAAKEKPKKAADAGLMGMFARSGVQSSLNKVIQGAGQVKNASDKVTGSGGGDSGAGIESGLKEVSQGGVGEATVGRADIDTKGKNSGLGDIGNGGLGQKGTSKVDIGGEGAEFVGSIDKEAIRRVILANIAQVRACYNEELNKNFNLSGKVIVQWDIVANGVVSRASVKSSTLKNRNVEQCILRRLKTWRFPEPPKGTTAGVAYPFLFTAQ